MSQGKDRSKFRERLYRSRSQDQPSVHPENRPAPPKILGESEAVKGLGSKIRLAANGAPRPALLLGQTGSGKELVARWLHFLSPRALGPYEEVNCAAINELLAESELFGHEKGAFTGALETKRGAFEQASGGVILLDEVNLLPMPLQGKLLRVLQERRFKRVGGERSIRHDAWVISLSNVDLRTQVKRGLFRNDLLMRLRVIEIKVPPLSERPGDILILANEFLSREAKSLGYPLPGLSEDAKARLLSHHWPGNVRELDNALTAAVVMREGRTIRAEDLHLESQSDETNTNPVSEKEPGSKLISMLEAAGNNVAAVARTLGISRPALYRRMKALGVSRKFVAGRK